VKNRKHEKCRILIDFLSHSFILSYIKRRSFYNDRINCSNTTKQGNTKDLTIIISIENEFDMETDLKDTVIFHRKLKVTSFQKTTTD